MSEARDVHYWTVPQCESWMIPLWDYRDLDEFEDLTSSLAAVPPGEAVWTFYGAVRNSDAVGVRLYVGTDLPSGITLVLSSATRAAAAKRLARATGFMAEREVVPWRRIEEQFDAIREAVLADESVDPPSFGLSAVVPDAGGRYTEAPTSWLADHGR